jgi:hypothetical protein
MALLKKLAVLGAAAEAARRYAQKNPEKVRELTDKAAKFADQQTKGKYSNQINQAKHKVAGVAGIGPADPTAPANPTDYPGQPGPTPFKRDE